MTLSRADWNAVLDQLEELNDAVAVADAKRECEREASGEIDPERDYLTGRETRRVLEGIHPISVWREKRGLTQGALAQAAAISPSHLSEIERKQKGPSIDVLQRIAAALGATVNDLLPA